MPGPEPTPTQDVSLTRAEKEKLLQRMYTLPHWIAVIRLFGYEAMQMDQARKEIKPIAEQNGKDPVAGACEALIEIYTEQKEAFARLKPHIRRMAFQILGPEPTLAAPTVAPAPEPQTEPPRPPEKRKSRKPAAASAPQPAAVKNDPTPNGRSAIMAQYQAAK